MHAPFPEPCNIFYNYAFFRFIPLDLLSFVFIISTRRAPRSGLSSCWAILKYYQSILKYYQSINQSINHSKSNTELGRQNMGTMAAKRSARNVCKLNEVWAW